MRILLILPFLHNCIEYEILVADSVKAQTKSGFRIGTEVDGKFVVCHSEACYPIVFPLMAFARFRMSTDK
jgi:hypothetical protein